MTQPEPERQLSFRTLAELPRQATGPDNQHIRPEVWKQWTFVVEIVAVSSSDYYDTIMVVRDGDEQVLTVGFDLDELDGMQDLIETTFKTGCTLLILEAHKIELHGGKNVTGIEVTDLSQIKVLPFSLSTVIGIYSKLLGSTSVENNQRICNGCDRRHRKLHPCPLCRMAYFCNNECQVRSLNERGHARDCHIARDPDLADLLHDRVLLGFRSVKLINV